MIGLEWHTNFLKILAILFVLISASGRFNRKKLLNLATLTIIPLSILIYWSGEGTAGLLFSLSGLTVASCCSLPFFWRDKITLTELLTSGAMGGIIGPFGSALVFLIMLTLYLTQQLLNAHTTLISDRFSHFDLGFGATFTTTDHKSSLTRIEAKRIMLAETRNFDVETSSLRFHDGIPATDPDSGHRTLPWGGKLALATLAILITGLFI
ncbi:MAG: hypothetical protein JXB45_09940 [Candidatus Krumholzibacteriota bacterium]|nr:hypothetical protein [Candidatus Krumholzibacteriota bacterium]